MLLLLLLLLLLTMMMFLFIWVLAMPVILAGVPRMVKVINLIVVKLDNFIHNGIFGMMPFMIVHKFNKNNMMHLNWESNLVGIFCVLLLE